MPRGTDTEEDDLAHGTPGLEATSPRVQIAILTERFSGLSKQVTKMDKAQDEMFDKIDQVKDLVTKLSLHVPCPTPGACVGLKVKVDHHADMFAKLEGAKRATIVWCSGLSFFIGIVSPYIVKVVFK